MWSRDGGRTNLFLTISCAKIAPRRVPNCLVPELGWRKPKRRQLFPSILENATSIEDLRRKRCFQFDEAQPRESTMPPSTKLGCGLISIGQTQIPSQQSCWQRDTA